MVDDFYQILGLPSTASEDEIKSAYRKKAKELHPDVNPGGAEDFKKVVEAYKTLSDTSSRQAYDRKKVASNFSSKFTAATSAASNVVQDILKHGEIFDTLDKFLGRTPEVKNIEIKVKITLEELYNGSDKKVSFKREEVCDSCKGKGAKSNDDFKVCNACYGLGTSPSLKSLFRKENCKICKGFGKIIINKCDQCNGKGLVKKDIDLVIPLPSDLSYPLDRLIVPGEGEGSGDLIIQVEVLPHTFYEVCGLDLSIELPVNFYQAILGDYIEIDTLKGPAHFKLLEGTQSGDTLTLKGYGLKRENQVGDLHITYSIMTPKKITKAQKDLLEEFRDVDKLGKLKPRKRSRS